ncbi:MAG: peptidylprolyl isomerase [Acidobacteriota bacterium]
MSQRNFGAVPSERGSRTRFRRSASWTAAAAVAVLLAARCASPRAGHQAPPAPPGAPTTVPTAAPPVPAAPLSGLQAEAALVELEDRRAFDEAALRAMAGSEDPATRARTALAAGRIGEPGAEPLLRTLLADPDPSVRAAAALSASLVPGGTLTPDLVPLLGDPDVRVARSAARSIGFLARPEGENALVAAMAGAGSELRPALLDSLWRFSNDASEAALLPWAADGDPPTRAAALYALSRKPRPGSLAVLTSALADANADSAAAAARALGILGRPESAEALAAALDRRGAVTVNALLALEALFDKAPAARVSDARRQRVLELAGDANPNVAVPALALLRQFAAADRDVARRLWSIGLSGEGRRRQVAVQSLVAALRGGARSALDAAAGSDDAFLRAAAAESLVFLGTPDAAPYRDRFSTDREVVVRLANLAGLKTADAVRENRPLVHAALTDPDPGVRAAAVETLAIPEDPAVLPLLAEAAEKARAERAPDVEISVIAACEKWKNAPAAAAIVEGIFHGGKTLPARLARRSLVASFGRTIASLPPPEYATGKTRADYAALLVEAKKPRRATVETAAGTFSFRLAGGAAPLTVMNFVSLARTGYFDGVRIHRVVPNFVLQDGDPTATGNGGPGWEIRDEIGPLEYVRGAVGMALSGADTGGSQWFVTHSPQPHLNGLYTIFGQITEGQSAVERIPQGERILRVTISEPR